MSKDPYDPRTLGLAAGSSSDPLNLGLSDKGAKDFKDAMVATENTSKMGGFLQFFAALGILDKFSSNPLSAVFFKFIDVVTSRLNAEFAESAGKLAEYLFSEKSQERMDKMAKITERVNKNVDVLITGVELLDKRLTPLTANLEKWGVKLEYLAGPLSMLLNFTTDMKVPLDDLNDKLGALKDKFDDLIDKIKDLLGL